MKRTLLEELQRARRGKVPVAVVTDLANDTQGLVYADHLLDAPLPPDSALVEDIRAMLRSGRSGTLPDSELFVRSYLPAYRLLIVGAVHIAQALAGMAQGCGYEVIIIDPRRAFATPERFRGVELCRDWPDEAMVRLAPDAQTAVVTLGHDPKIDDPALIAALNSEAFYIGALGSRRTHGKRLERLAEHCTPAQLERINAPVGLNLGGRAHTEIAVAILAQLIQARYGV